MNGENSVLTSPNTCGSQHPIGCNCIAPCGREKEGKVNKFDATSMYVYGIRLEAQYTRLWTSPHQGLSFFFFPLFLAILKLDSQVIV